MAGSATAAASMGAASARPAGAPAAPAAEACSTPKSTESASTNTAAGGVDRPAPAGRLTPAKAPGAAHETAPAADGFAALLMPPMAVATTPSAATTAAPTAPVAADIPPDPTPATPEQLLALLAGAWALPPVPAPAPRANLPAGGESSTTGVMSMLQLPALGTAATANDASLASPLATLRMSGEPGTPAALDGALPELTAATVNASDTAPTFDTALTGLGGPTAPAPAPVRDVAPAPAPLALPADPDAGFDDGFGARIAWMADQRLGQAQIRLNPEHLGPIEVSLQLDGSRVDAQFHSTHVEVRAALEASVPRLRELLGQHGLQLGQADVGQRQSAWTPAGQAAAPMQGGGEAGESVPGTAEVITHRRGLLDEYA